MPSIEQNLQKWNKNYDWNNQGEEWSLAWGSSEAQWHRTIFPRVKDFLPAHTILEIGPGYGRWTNYLKDHCERLILVDLAETCIEACQKRFSTETNITYHVNDGKSLDMIPDGSVDFIFSFDSLVHAEPDVMRSYVDQFTRKLKPHGAGLVHHSNLGEYREKYNIWHRLITSSAFSSSMKIPGALRDFFIQKCGWHLSTHSRSTTMTASLFEQYCCESDLQCVTQELISWGREDSSLIDTISIFAPKGSKWSRPNAIIRNPNFMKEAIL